MVSFFLIDESEQS